MNNQSVQAALEQDRELGATAIARGASLPRLITDDDLREQRRVFALDSAEDRPYHSLSHARVRRGRPWNDDRGVRYGVPTDYGWDYESTVPHLRSRVAMNDDRARWCQALRQGA